MGEFNQSLGYLIWLNAIEDSFIYELVPQYQGEWPHSSSTDAIEILRPALSRLIENGDVVVWRDNWDRDSRTELDVPRALAAIADNAAWLPPENWTNLLGFCANSESYRARPAR